MFTAKWRRLKRGRRSTDCAQLLGNRGFAPRMTAPATPNVRTCEPLDCLLVLLRASLYPSRQAERLSAIAFRHFAVFLDHRNSPIPGAESINLSAAVELKYIGV
jgi:hypothetical protein